jgi:propane monooxygenase reductase subunit
MNDAARASLPPGFSVTVLPAGTTFKVRPGDDILTAALRAGVPLPYSCRRGNCGTCKQWIASGEVAQLRTSPYVLSESERDEGYALLCSALPLADVVIAPTTPEANAGALFIAPRQYRGRVARSDTVPGGLTRLAVVTDAPVRFHPGQYAELSWVGRSRLPLTMTSIPDGTLEVTFAVDHRVARTRELSLGSEVHLEAPFGNLVLRPAERPVVLVAHNLGIASVLGILHHIAEIEPSREVTAYLSHSGGSFLPLAEELAAVEARLGALRRIELTTPEEVRGASTATPALRAIGASVADASDLDAYIAGPVAFCDAVGELLTAKGCRPSRLHVQRLYPVRRQAVARPAVQGAELARDW